MLAVTACPTGIAHTYMAAESLEQHAKRKIFPSKLKQMALAVEKYIN